MESTSKSINTSASSTSDTERTSATPSSTISTTSSASSTPSTSVSTTDSSPDTSASASSTASSTASTPSTTASTTVSSPETSASSTASESPESPESPESKPEELGDTDKTSISPEKLNLELGDIIQISAPDNDKMDEHIFLIEYIDSDMIRLIDDANLSITTLTIIDGNISDESIQFIAILSKPNEKGYARQNSLLPGKWIEIYFGGDVPTIITGKITNLEEDMIELETYPSKEVIYIDFAYKGIPIDLPIRQINIREEPPKDFEMPVSDVEPDTDLPAISEEKDEEDAMKETVTPDGTDQPAITMRVPTKDIEAKIKEVLVEADEISFGDEVESITQEVYVPEEEKRFALDVQANDLLDEMLSTIPNIERTSKVLNKIHIMITRFKELRRLYSSFDKTGNIIGTIKKGADYKPLVNKLHNLHTNLYWLLPVVKNRRKLYDIDEFEEEDDVVLKMSNTDIPQIETLMSDYKNNKLGESANNYTSLIQRLDPYFTPFEAPIDSTDLLTEREVSTNVTALTNNIVSDLEEFYASVSKNDKLNRQRFVMTKYNLGLNKLKMTKDKSFKTEQLTRADTLSLKSIVTLPESFVRYSHINLPSTTIYDKTNLNHVNLAYWKVLRDHTSITTKTITSLDEETNYDEESFLANIRDIVLADGIDEEDKYKKFLQVVIPRTRNLFGLIKKYINDGTSLAGIISYLEPFMVYRDDISFKQYEEIVGFINENIVKLKQTLATNIKDTNVLRNLKTAVKYTASLMVDIMGPQKGEIESSYQISEHNNLPGEVYMRMIDTDYGNYYNNVLSIADSDLYSNIDIDAQLNETIQHLDDKLDQTPNECANYVLTKKYISIDELNDDDGTSEVYYDKKYDQTRYDILDEYKSEMDAMNPEEFKQFLISKLMSNIGLPEDVAVRDTDAMIYGRRKIQDGEYAVLENMEDSMVERYYYKRDNDKWVLDDKVTELARTDDSKVFCNIREKCLQLKKDCESVEVSKDKLMKTSMEAIVKSVSDQDMQSKEKLMQELASKNEHLKTVLHNIIRLKVKQLLRNNNSLYNLGLKVESGEILVSPHAHLRDLILAETDISKRSTYLIRFADKYTRSADPDSEESPYWMYCNMTNTKLLPSFYYQLALTFMKGENYLHALDRICAERGEISDDGDKWVDKHSGYTIRMIDYADVDEYTEEGYKVQTGGVLSSDPIVAPADEGKDELYNSPEAIVVRKVASALAFYTGLNINDHLQFIIGGATKYASQQMPTKELYARKVEIAKRKGKKMISFEKKYNQLLLFFTGLYFLIAVQTSVPGLKTRKTFPGCAKSFSGYPTMVNGDNYGGLEYVTCVMKKISSSQSPWDAIKGLSEASLKKNFMVIFDKILAKDGEIQTKIKGKQEVVTAGAEFGEDDIPDVLNVSAWSSFLPPLVDVKLGTVRKISKDFKTALNENIKHGRPEQNAQLSIIQGKILSFSLKILEDIQDIVAKEPAILETMGGEPFLQNVCCNDEENKRTVDYFINKRPSIKDNNKIVKSLTKLYNNTINLAKSAMLFNDEDTKLKYDALRKEHSEKTIYKAFFKYCNYNTDIPIMDALKPVCMTNQSAFEVDDPIEDKIRVMKEEGKMYTGEHLQELMKIINRENMVHLDLDKHIANATEIITSILKHFDESDSDVSPILRKHMEEMIGTYDIVKQTHNESVRKMRNYLITSAKQLREEIKSFLTDNGNMNRNLKKKVFHFIDSIGMFETFESSGDVLTSKEETVIYEVQYMMNVLQDMTMTLPNIILNKVSYKYIPIPKHWKLSPLHQQDISTFINKNYAALNAYYGHEDMRQLLINIQAKTRDLRILIQEMPFIASLKIGDETHESIFGSVVLRELFYFYFLSVVKEYIDLHDVVSELSVVGTGAAAGIDMGVEGEDITDIEEVEVSTGDKMEMRSNVSALLVTYMEMFMRQKQRINMNRDHIMELVLRSKEKEKDIKTRQLKELTDEERKADSELRKAKLGRWNIGLQKGLTQYVKGRYDLERREMEEEAIIDFKLGELGGVTDMNRDLFSMDLLEEEMRRADIEAEALGMEELPDDDDFGEADGDEHFY